MKKKLIPVVLTLVLQTLPFPAKSDVFRNLAEKFQVLIKLNKRGPNSNCPQGRSDSAALDSEARVWTSNGYSNVSLTTLDVYPKRDPLNFSHSFDLDVVLIRGTGWTKATLEDRYRKVASIYAQCKIKLAETVGGT